MCSWPSIVPPDYSNPEPPSFVVVCLHLSVNMMICRGACDTDTAATLHKITGSAVSVRLRETPAKESHGNIWEAWNGHSRFLISLSGCHVSASHFTLNAWRLLYSSGQILGFDSDHDLVVRLHGPPPHYLLDLQSRLTYLISSSSKCSHGRPKALRGGAVLDLVPHKPLLAPWGPVRRDYCLHFQASAFPVASEGDVQLSYSLWFAALEVSNASMMGHLRAAAAFK